MTFQLVDMLLPLPSMVDILIIATGRLLPAIYGYGDAFTRTSYGGYASLSNGYFLTRTTKVDMVTTAMGMEMLLLNTYMDRPLPETSYGGYASPD